MTLKLMMNTPKRLGRLKKQVKAHPENTQAYLDLIEAIEFQELFNPKGDKKTEREAALETIYWLTSGIKTQPDNKELYRKRAEIYFSDQQYQKAQADYTDIIKRDSQDEAAFLSRGQVNEAIGLKKEARQDFDTYTNFTPKMSEQFHKRGLFHYFRGHFDLAVQDFSKDIELNPKKGSGYIFRAEIYFLQNRFDDSIADYQKMNELDPETVGFGLARMGMNYYYQGKYQLAEDAFTESLKRDPYLSTVMDWYLSRKKQGKTSKAALEYIANQFGNEFLEGAVIHLFLDKISPEALLEKKIDRSEIILDTSLSTAYFCVGQYYLMRDNPYKAKTMFEKSIQVNEQWFDTGKLFSEKELARLKTNKNFDTTGK